VHGRIAHVGVGDESKTNEDVRAIGYRDIAIFPEERRHGWNARILSAKQLGGKKSE